MNKLREKLKNYQILRSFVYRIREIRDQYSFCIGRNTIINKGIKIKSLVQVSGQGNKVVIMSQSVLKRVKILVIGNNNQVIIKNHSYLEGTRVHIEDNDCLIEIGEHTFIGPSHIACTENGNSIIIGKHCMLSSNINIRTGDSHSIIDADGKRINPGASVAIGDHVWIGEGAKIMKGVQLQQDSIVASGAIVTRSFPSNVIVAGNPARCIKEGVNWDSQRL